MLHFRSGLVRKLSGTPVGSPRSLSIKPILRLTHKPVLWLAHKLILIGPSPIFMLFFVNTLCNSIYNMYFVKSLLYKLNIYDGG